MSQWMDPALPEDAIGTRAHRDRHGDRLGAGGHGVTEVTDGLDNLLNNPTQHLLHVPRLPQPHRAVNGPSLYNTYNTLSRFCAASGGRIASVGPGTRRGDRAFSCGVVKLDPVMVQGVKAPLHQHGPGFGSFADGATPPIRPGQLRRSLEVGEPRVSGRWLFWARR